MDIYIAALIACLAGIIGVLIYLLRKRKTLAFEAVKREAEKGGAQARTLLGFMYYSGMQTPQDMKKASEEFLKAAEQGSPEAQFFLGGLLISDKYIERNPAEGVKWIAKSAENGFLPAQTALANIYAEGRFAPRNAAESVKWFMAAAMAGDVTSQKTVAGIYDFSVGMDKKTAYAWYMTAAASGDAYAAEMAEKLASAFTEDEKKAAQTLASNNIRLYAKKRGFNANGR